MPAYASPAGLVELPLRGSFLRAAPADCARGGIPLQTPLAHVPADPRLPKPMTHTRPRGRLQASCLSPCGPAFGCSILFQQNCPCPYPLVWNHPNDAISFGKLRAGTNGPKKHQRLMPAHFFGHATRVKPKTKNQKPKTKNQKPKTNIRPQAAKNDSGCWGFPGPFGPARR